MTDETTEGTAAKPALGTLADKVNWLVDRARPAGRGPYTNAELAALLGAKLRPAPLSWDDRRGATMGHDGQPCPCACST